MKSTVLHKRRTTVQFIGMGGRELVSLEEFKIPLWLCFVCVCFFAYLQPNNRYTDDVNKSECKTLALTTFNSAYHTSLSISGLVAYCGLMRCRCSLRSGNRWTRSGSRSMLPFTVRVTKLTDLARRRRDTYVGSRWLYTHCHACLFIRSKFCNLYERTSAPIFHSSISHHHTLCD